MEKKGAGLETLRQYFSRDAFAGLCGIDIVEASEGHAVALVRIEDRHLNGLKVVHGGLLFTLADMAFAAAAHTRGKVSVSINSSISYIKAARGRTLRAEATEVSRDNRLASYAINIMDETGEVVATAQGLAYVKKENL